AVGCYYGGLLARAGHEVTFIGRRTHVDAINAHGLLLDTQVFKQYFPARAGTDASSLASPDLVLFFVNRPIPKKQVRLGPHPCARRRRFSVFKTVSTTPSVSAPSPDPQSFPPWSMSAAKWSRPATSSITVAEHS